MGARPRESQAKKGYWLALVFIGARHRRTTEGSPEKLETAACLAPVVPYRVLLFAGIITSRQSPARWEGMEGEGRGDGKFNPTTGPLRIAEEVYPPCPLCQRFVIGVRS